MRLQPVLQGARFPVRQQADGPARSDVHQDDPVDLAAPQGEIIDSEDLRRGADPGLGQRGDQPQQRGPVRRGAQHGGQPGPGPARQSEPEIPCRGPTCINDQAATVSQRIHPSARVLAKCSSTRQAGCLAAGRCALIV